MSSAAILSLNVGCGNSRYGVSKAISSNIGIIACPKGFVSYLDSEHNGSIVYVELLNFKEGEVRVPAKQLGSEMLMCCAAMP